MLLIGHLHAQVGIPAAQGGFENATSTFAANGWSTAIPGLTRDWRVGTAAGAASGTKAAYLGSATNNNGSNSATYGYFYRDVTVPGGSTNVLLNFKVKVSTIDNGWDYLDVYVTTPAYTPVAGTDVYGSPGYTNVLDYTSPALASFTAQPTVDLTYLAGTTIRLVFEYTSDGITPHANFAVDDVSLNWTTCTGVAPGVDVTSSTACEGGDLFLTGNITSGSATVFSWTGPNGFMSALQNPMISGLDPLLHSGTYTLTAGNGPGTCAGTDNETVTVGWNPTLTLAADPDPACAGGSTTLQAVASPNDPVVASAASGAVNLAIQDNNTTSTNLTLSDGAGSVVAGSTVTVTLNITHTYDADLDIYLDGPGGCGTLELSTDNGGSGDNYTNTVIQTGAGTPITGGSAPFTGTFAPEGNISALATCPVNGTWTLRVADDAGGDTGTLLDWGLSISTNPVGGNYTTVFGGPGLGGTTYFGANDHIAEAVASALAAGTNSFSATVTAPNGCQASASVDVEGNAPLANGEILPAAPLLCTPGALELTANPIGGGGPFTFLWSPGGETTATKTVTTSGSYSCLITDACGGSFMANTNVAASPTPMASATSNSPVCEGHDLMLDGSSDIGSSFSWTGPNGLNETTEDVTLNGATAAAAGEYTFTATAGGCTSAPQMVNVMMDPSPTGVSADATDLEVCPGNVVDLTSTADLPSSSVLSEDFNGGAAGWSQVNNSTGGTPANAAWALFTSPYAPGGSWSGNFSSNDASQFAFSNSDAQGSGATLTETYLLSPAFDLTGYTAATLSFWHYYRDIGTGDNADVDVSTDGGTNWSTIQSWTSTQGTQTGFVNANLSLDVFVGQSSVIIRFHYHAAGWDWGWAIDNVSVTGTPAPLQFSWSSDPFGFSGMGQDQTGVVVATAPIDYIVTVTGSNGCTTSASVSLTLNAPPLPTSIGSYAICDGAAVPIGQGLTATAAPPPAVVNWYDASIGGTLWGTSEIFDPVTAGAVNASVAGIYTFYAANEVDGCEGDRTPAYFFVGNNDLDLAIETDNNGNETSWEITADGLNVAVCSGSGYGNNMAYTESCCLPDGDYVLTFFDSMGDGMSNGGYRLSMANGDRVIDNWEDGVFGSTSSTGRTFHVPLGTDHLVFADCDREDWQPTEFIVASPNAAVSAEWGVGDQTDDGYQFWFSNPDGGYNRLILRNHATSGGYGPAGPTRACHLRLSSMVTLPLPYDVLLNVRVRSLVNGMYSAFGPACRFMMPSTPPSCPTTMLIDNPSNPNYSCGVSRAFGGSDKVYCYPVSGANKYRWSFRNSDEGFLRNIASNNAGLVLNWVTLPLVDGGQYWVLVQASFDNGANYCPFGDSCLVTIDNPAAALHDRTAMLDTEQNINLFPNPNNGDQVYLTMNDLPEGVENVSVEMFDMYGKRVMNITRTADDGLLHTEIDLDATLASGLYLVNVTAGDRTWTRRLLINK
ncbi:MAG: choice-of-anchor J domain-containing protein [Flavobacteriales bacterium]|nr:choice-of-anchor J domain-containing protein [Flavobacteriales bacterium]